VPRRALLIRTVAMTADAVRLSAITSCAPVRTALDWFDRVVTPTPWNAWTRIICSVKNYLLHSWRIGFHGTFGHERSRAISDALLS
jgi:hypothetical protein